MFKKNLLFIGLMILVGCTLEEEQPVKKIGYFKVMEQYRGSARNMQVVVYCMDQYHDCQPVQESISNLIAEYPLAELKGGGVYWDIPNCQENDCEFSYNRFSDNDKDHPSKTQTIRCKWSLISLDNSIECTPPT